MSNEYEWTEVSMGFSMTKPATFHKWVWLWQVGWHKTRGWFVEDRTFLKVKICRELRLEDYIYGDGTKPTGLGALDLNLHSDGTSGIDRGTTSFWRTQS